MFSKLVADRTKKRGTNRKRLSSLVAIISAAELRPHLMMGRTPIVATTLNSPLTIFSTIAVRWSSVVRALFNAQ